MIRVSVVIPTFRRPDLLGRCLAALDAQAFDPEAYEVLVADDAASEATRRQVEKFAKTARPTIRYVAVTGSHGPAAARNAGWRQARGPIIAFTDDDCVPDPQWLAEGTALFTADPKAAAVTGRTVVPLSKQPTDYERDAAGLEKAEFVTANCFLRREVLEAVGGFDERFSTAWREDSDLQFTLLRRGYRIVRAEGAVVVHPVRPAPWAVCLRQQPKVPFDALLYKKHRDLYRARFRHQPRWDYFAMVALLGSTAAAALAGHGWAALGAAAIWAMLTGRFCALRLRGSSRAPGHIAEMVLTSALIPIVDPENWTTR